MAGPSNTQIDVRSDVATVAVVGELDMSTAPTLEEDLASCLRGGASVIILDLRDLSFVDCAGLHALLRARNEAGQNGHRFSISGASATARRLFELTGTEFLLEQPEGNGDGPGHG